MMRETMVVLACLLSLGACAQLRVPEGGDAGAMGFAGFTQRGAEVGEKRRSTSVLLTSLSAPLREPLHRNAPTFDFTATRPHLAFFCRLEINEAAGNIIPAKFRLGGHQHWQDQLSKRD